MKPVNKIINYLYDIKPHFLVPVFLIIAVIMVTNFCTLNIDPIKGLRIYDADHQTYQGADFMVFYSAAKKALSGENFYLQSKYLVQTVNGSYVDLAPYVYPPLLAYSFIPFALFEIGTSFHIYTLFVVCLALSSIFLLNRLLADMRWQHLLLSSIILFCSPIMWAHIERGQTDIVVLFLICLSCYLFSKKYFKFSGVCIGFAALFKLTPIIFIPYLFIKNKISFFSSLIVLVFGSLIFGWKSHVYFFYALKSFCRGFATSSIFSNGLFGVIYNRFTRDYLSFSGVQAAYFFIILFFVMLLFYIFFKRLKSVNYPEETTLLLSEFSILSCGMILIPNVSWIYNGVHLLVLFTAWYLLRIKKYLLPIEAVIGDILIYLIFAQPLFISAFQNLPGSLLFVLRPVYVSILLIIILRVHRKISYGIIPSNI